jgi:DNA-binding protein HU-beta
LNKTDVIDSLETRLGDRKVATAALEGLIDIINRAVAKGEKVSITGFGSFERVTRSARIARNPRTGEQIRLKKTAVPKFRPGAQLKDVASGATKLGREPKHVPLLPSGVTRIVANAAKEQAAAATKTAAGTTAKTAAAKKTAAKKAPAKTAAKKTAAKTAPAKQTAAKKAPAKAAPAKKTAARKTASR